MAWHANTKKVYLFLFFSQYIRLYRIGPFGESIHSALEVFLDDKDSGPLILTHVYLLLGLAVPLWLYPVDFSKRDSTGEYGITRHQEPSILDDRVYLPTSCIVHDLPLLFVRIDLIPDHKFKLPIMLAHAGQQSSKISTVFHCCSFSSSQAVSLHCILGYLRSASVTQWRQWWERLLGVIAGQVIVTIFFF